MRSRRAITWGVAAVILCAVIGVVAAVRRAPQATTDELPTAVVKRGDLDMKVYVTGELRATHSEMLTAPPIGGGALQITHLLHTGTVVKKGDLVIEFDPTEQHFKLDQNRSELLQAEQEITKARADAAVVAAQGKGIGITPRRAITVGNRGTERRRGAVAKVPSIAGDGIIVTGTVTVESQLHATHAISWAADSRHGRRAGDWHHHDTG